MAQLEKANKRATHQKRFFSVKKRLRVAKNIKLCKAPAAEQQEIGKILKKDFVINNGQFDHRCLAKPIAPLIASLKVNSDPQLRLGEGDKQSIVNCSELTGSHIELVMSILKRQFPATEGLEGSLLSQSCRGFSVQTNN